MEDLFSLDELEYAFNGKNEDNFVRKSSHRK